jgi:hypothetical protein
MIWVQDKHVVVVVDNALAGGGEVSNDVNKGVYCAWRVEPGLS